jgi:hypothetical protein
LLKEGVVEGGYSIADEADAIGGEASADVGELAWVLT